MNVVVDGVTKLAQGLGKLVKLSVVLLLSVRIEVVCHGDGLGDTGCFSKIVTVC